MRKLIVTAFALLLTSCATQRSADSTHPVAVAAGRFVIEAVPATGSDDDYRWEAFDARVANAIHWSSAVSSTHDGGIAKEGRLNEAGLRVVATGSLTYVTELSIDTDAVHAVAVLDALRQAGADVSFQADYESYSEYIVTPRGRDVALLTTHTTCIPFEPQPGVVCRNYLTLKFNPE
jgi:hypothetical protein